MVTERLPFAIRRTSSAGLDVVALGENSLDVVATWTGSTDAAAGRPRGKQTLDRMSLHPGGQMATAALGCARLGLRVRYIGAFGTDDLSVRSRQPLDAAGVDVVGIVRPGTPGRTAVVLVDAVGDRQVLEYRHPALRIDVADLSPDLIGSAPVLLVDATHPEAAAHAVGWARDRGTVTIVDVDEPGPAADRLLEAVDVVIVPESFLEAWSGTRELREGLSRLARHCAHAALLIVTCGARGSLTLYRDRFISTPACPIEPVDTTGAGDAFRAGFAAALLHLGPEAPIDAVLRFAHVTAALNCRATGAQDGLPTLDEVLARVG